MVFIAPALIHFVIPESPRWHLRRGRVEAAVDTVNRIISRAGNRVPPLSVEALSDDGGTTRERLPSYWALFRPGQLRWTVVGILSSMFAGIAALLIHILLPKALVDQGAAVSLSFGLATIIYAASIPGKAFTAYLMAIIGRRWTIFYALAGSLPGVFLMMMAHRAGTHASIVMLTGGLITGFTVLSSFSATRVICPSSSRRHCAGAATSSASRSGGSSPACWRRSLWPRTPARRRSFSARSWWSWRSAPSSR
jgi:hypothetical protein